MDLPNQSPSQSLTRVITQLLECGAVGVVVTVVAGENVGAKMLIDESQRTLGTLNDPELDSLVAQYAVVFLSSREEIKLIHLKDIAQLAGADTSFLFERLQRVHRLVVCGAGHVGAALARLGVFAGYHTTLIDDRAEFVNRERFPETQIHLVLTNNWTEATTEAVGDGSGVSVAVVTRGHNEDEECLQAVVRANPDYVGMIGSKRRTNIVIDRLRNAGVSDTILKNVRAPIGLDIGAVSPEEVALAIIAEIVAERRGGKGESLSAWRRAEYAP
jgi:xanthine dehydrogenase accessory factor